MKILVYGDPHWCAYSSIVRSRGNKYSTRLENLIQTMNWIEDTAVNNYCERIICLGDFFDRAELTGEEITALEEIRWTDIMHTYIVGNHEMARSDVKMSTAHLFGLSQNFEVADSVGTYNCENVQLCFLPYVLESDRKPLEEYLVPTTKDRIIFSHNDIKDIQMGRFKSTEGFSIEEIERNCRLFVNGHIHNTSHVGSKIINLGNITGQNFSEDANYYRHYALLIDTDTFGVEFIENPYAFNFYKLSLVGYEPLTDTDMTIPDIFKFGTTGTAIVTVKTCKKNEAIVRQSIKDNPNIIESRVIVDMMRDTQNTVSETVTDFSVDHLSQFVSYMTAELGESEQVLDELRKVAGI